jgi:ABC-type tungstate transport system permease subunit
MAIAQTILIVPIIAAPTRQTVEGFWAEYRDELAAMESPGVKKELGQAFVDRLISPEGQKVIAGYKIDGQHLFFPDADRKGA